MGNAVMCTSLTPHLASAFHRTSQVSQLHLPSMPMRQSIENALQTGELARSLVNTLCVEPAAQPGAGRVREHWPGVLGHTPQPQPAPTAASPASRQLRSKGPTQASAILRLAMGWCPRSPAVSTARALLSPHCRSADPSTPAGRLAVSPRLEDLPDRPQGRTVTEGAQAEALGTRYATAKIVELDLFTSSQAMFRRVPCLG